VHRLRKPGYVPWRGLEGRYPAPLTRARAYDLFGNALAAKKNAGPLRLLISPRGITGRSGRLRVKPKLISSSISPIASCGMTQVQPALRDRRRGFRQGLTSSRSRKGDVLTAQLVRCTRTGVGTRALLRGGRG